MRSEINCAAEHFQSLDSPISPYPGAGVSLPGDDDEIVRVEARTGDASSATVISMNPSTLRTSTVTFAPRPTCLVMLVSAAAGADAGQDPVGGTRLGT